MMVVVGGVAGEAVIVDFVVVEGVGIGEGAEVVAAPVSTH